ncbi:hypothetical protein FQA47_001051 [Oryzias melastigma]|uniref:Uncharacterized protein n=1 Tax=Oryzias melastigma TaxID=30732 RepID=A0A834FNK0_ORYME|nr:hypothetical protein FQA47_001051 [Oryzias melastigma]
MCSGVLSLSGLKSRMSPDSHVRLAVMSRSSQKIQFPTAPQGSIRRRLVQSERGLTQPRPMGGARLQVAALLSELPAALPQRQTSL